MRSHYRTALRTSLRTSLRASVAGLCLFGALALTACGSSGGAGTNNSDNASTGTAGSAIGSSGLSATEASFLASSEKAPTTLTVNMPLKEAPPKANTFVWLQCEVTACTLIGEGLQAATAALGWHMQTITYNDADVATLIAGLKRALTYNPVAVGVSGVPPAAGWQSELAEYKSKQIPIVGSFLGATTLDDTLISNVGGPATFSLQARIMADWFIQDSGGTGHALLEVVTSYPTLNHYASAFADNVKNECPKCSITTIDNTVADLTSGNIVKSVVSAAQRNPQAKYVITSDGAFVAGLPAALSAAGLGGKIKIGGAFPDATNLTGVKNGTENAFTGIAYLYSGWLMIDSLLRHQQGMAFTADNPLPTQLLTKDVDFKISTTYDVPESYITQFKQLWHIG